MEKYTQSKRASHQSNNVHALDIAQHTDGEITTDTDGEMSSNTDFDKRIIAELTKISKELKKRKKIKVRHFLPLYSLLMTAYKDCLEDDSSEEEAECDQQTMDEFLKILERKSPAKCETPQPRSIVPKPEMDKQSKTRPARSITAKLPHISLPQTDEKESEKIIRPLATIPFIMLHDKSDYRNILKEVNEKNIAMSALDMKTGIRIESSEMDDYLKMSSFLQEMGIYHHSYAPPEDKYMDVVIRGIPMSEDLEDITTALENKGYPVLNAFRMTRGIQNKQTPLIVLSLENTKKAWEIYQVKSLYWYCTSVEGIQRSTDDGQCQRCQRIGHYAALCFGEPVWDY